MNTQIWKYVPYSNEKNKKKNFSPVWIFEDDTELNISA